MKSTRSTRRELTLNMGKHKNPLEKEFLIKQYRLGGFKLNEFCKRNDISSTAFKKWTKQYDEGGIESLSRNDYELGDVLPPGIDRTEEAYKREILRLRIENERFKKNYTLQMKEDGTQEFIRLKMKNSK